MAQRISQDATGSAGVGVGSAVGLVTELSAEDVGCFVGWVVGAVGTVVGAVGWVVGTVGTVVGAVG